MKREESIALAIYAKEEKPILRVYAHMLCLYIIVHVNIYISLYIYICLSSSAYLSIYLFTLGMLKLWHLVF